MLRFLKITTLQEINAGHATKKKKKKYCPAISLVFEHHKFWFIVSSGYRLGDRWTIAVRRNFPFKMADQRSNPVTDRPNIFLKKKEIVAGIAHPFISLWRDFYDQIWDESQVKVGGGWKEPPVFLEV